MSILLPKIMKIEQKISLLGLKKCLRDESQQSLITAYIKLLKTTWENGSQDSSKPEVYHNSVWDEVLFYTV